MGDVRSGGGPLRWALVVVAAVAVVASGYWVGTWVASGRDGGDEVSVMDDAPAQVPPTPSSTSGGSPSTSLPASSPPPTTMAPPDATERPGAAPPVLTRCDEVGDEFVPLFDSAVGDRAFCTERWAAAVSRTESGTGLTILRAEESGWKVVVAVDISITPVPKALADAGVEPGHASVLCEAVAPDPEVSASC